MKDAVVVSLVISLVALGVSAFSLFVNFRNQLERRHGEITRLVSSQLHRTKAAEQVMLNMKIQLETFRLELRRRPDSEDKYNSIESLPGAIEVTESVIKKIVGFRETLEGIDTVRTNKSKLLIDLQAKDIKVDEVEDLVTRAEQDVLNILKKVRAERERNDET